MVEKLLSDGTLYTQLFVGTLIFCRTTDDGFFASLHEGDEEKIKRVVFRFLSTGENEYTRILDL